MRRPIEWAITSGILLVLLGLLFPVLRTRHIARQIEQAQADLEEIQRAVQRFTEDTGHYPSRGSDGLDGQLHRLLGPGPMAEGSYFRTDLHQGWLEDHLVRNGPEAQTCRPYEGWNGPYLDAHPDPWGRAYVLVVYPATRHDARDCIVVSAGPNGVMDADYSSPYDVRPSGDDLLLVLNDKSTEHSAPLF